jgi:hypothetical protein
MFGDQAMEKDYYPEPANQLSSEDELVTVDEYMMKRKRN